MQKWHIEIEQNGGEYFGWVTFFANDVFTITDQPNQLLVDNKIMEFDEKVVSITRIDI